MENPGVFLYMAVIGCTPPGRFTEQHDVFFGIGTSMQALVPEMVQWWPEAGGKLHIDAWRKVTCVNGHRISVTTTEDGAAAPASSPSRLFFLNLGGYKPGEFEEYHYKMLAVADTQGQAIQQSKKTAFYKHHGFKGAESHVDDKYGVDVDDVHEIEDILQGRYAGRYRLQITAGAKADAPEDELNIGYFKLEKL